MPAVAVSICEVLFAVEVGALPCLRCKSEAENLEKRTRKWTQSWFSDICITYAEDTTSFPVEYLANVYEV